MEDGDEMSDDETRGEVDASRNVGGYPTSLPRASSSQEKPVRRQVVSEDAIKATEATDGDDQNNQRQGVFFRLTRL